MSTRTVRRATVVDVAPEELWAWVTDFTNINHELRPLMQMRLPRRLQGITVADLRPGQRLGRIPILYGGILPLDYDDLTVAEIETGRFLERSTMGSMSLWQHERVIDPTDDGRSRLTDVLTFSPRLPLRPFTPMLVWLVGVLFSHRQRRVVEVFSVP